MGASDFTRRLFFAGEFALMAATIAAAVYVAQPDEWRPATLVVTLLAIALVGEWFTIKTRAGILSASLGVMVLAMGLLGPGPAGRLRCGGDRPALGHGPPRPAHWLNNLVAIGVAGFAGGLVVRALGGDVTRLAAQSATDSLVFVLMLFAGVAVLLVLNFVVFAMHQRVTTGRPLGRMTTELFFPLLPGELAVAVIAIILVLAYRGAGLPVLLAAIPVLLIFRQLAVALERSETHAEQLQARTRQLSSFQWGVPAMFMEGLGLRDPDLPASRRRRRQLLPGHGDRARLRGGRAGSHPPRRPAPRHRQVHLVRPAAAPRPAQRRRLGGDPPPPSGRCDHGRQARRLRARCRRDPLPPRARRRRRLPRRPDRQRDPAGGAHRGHLPAPTTA